MAFAELRGAQVTTKAACVLIGRPRASHYRHLVGPVHGQKELGWSPENGQVLTEAERAAVSALINTEDYGDLSIGQVWTRELDEGQYLCSMSIDGSAASGSAMPTILRYRKSESLTVTELRPATHWSATIRSIKVME
jgi:hypothetical protein